MTTQLSRAGITNVDFQSKVLKRILLILKFLHSAFVDFGLSLKYGVDQYFGHFGESEELGRSLIYLTPGSIQDLFLPLLSRCRILFRADPRRTWRLVYSHGYTLED